MSFARVLAAIVGGLLLLSGGGCALILGVLGMGGGGGLESVLGLLVPAVAVAIVGALLLRWGLRRPDPATHPLAESRPPPDREG